MTIATRKSWRNEPIQQSKKVEINLRLNQNQFDKLIKGRIPQEMEDKWFIFYEDDWIYFHRSWTGYGIFKAQILKQEDGYCIQDLWVETGPNYNNSGYAEQVETFSRLINLIT